MCCTDASTEKKEVLRLQKSFVSSCSSLQMHTNFESPGEDVSSHTDTHTCGQRSKELEINDRLSNCRDISKGGGHERNQGRDDTEEAERASN